MIDIKQLRKSLATDTYRDLREYLNLNLAQLKDIDELNEYSKAVDQAIEFKAQKKAYRKLEKIISQLIVIVEMPDPDAKPEGNDYGEDYIQPSDPTPAAKD